MSGQIYTTDDAAMLHYKDCSHPEQENVRLATQDELATRPKCGTCAGMVDSAVSTSFRCGSCGLVKNKAQLTVGGLCVDCT